MIKLPRIKTKCYPELKRPMWSNTVKWNYMNLTWYWAKLHIPFAAPELWQLIAGVAETG